MLQRGALSVITISDWVRAKVSDISQPSTHSIAVKTHPTTTLSSSPFLQFLPDLLLRLLSISDIAVFHIHGVSEGTVVV